MIGCSLFTGIGGFDLAMRRAGIDVATQVEWDAACQSVLRRQFPESVLYGDVREFRTRMELKHAGRFTTQPVRREHDIIVGGFPCQDLSLAGRRAGLSGERSGMWFVFRRLLGILRPRWVCIENVPGLLSSNDGRDLAVILSSLGNLGYGFAYRVLDSQWFGVPQRRRRVFIVGCFGDARRAAQVLFERECLPWDPPPSREARSRVTNALATGTADRGYRCDPSNEELVPVAALTSTGVGTCGADDNQAQAGHILAFQERGRPGGRAVEAQEDIAYSLNSPNGGGRRQENCIAFKASHYTRGKDGAPSEIYPALSADADKGDQDPLVLTPFADVADPLKANQAKTWTQEGSNNFRVSNVVIKSQQHDQHQPVAFAQNQLGEVRIGDVFNTLSTNSNASGRNTPLLSHVMAVRRLTPRECERLQAFPDDWTKLGHDGRAISDSARYRMLGNAVTVSVVEWIMRRIVAEDART